MIIEELSGPDVIIFDDTEREVKSIERALASRDIKYEFIKVDLAGTQVNHEKVASIKLVFLDLSYNIGFGSTFDPTFCANLIEQVVPSDRQYYLVAWTKDPENTEAVLEILAEIGLTPIGCVSKLKEGYRIKNDEYDADRLLKDLEIEFNKIESVKKYYGEIIDLEEDCVIVNCLIDEESKVFQVRRFDLEIFKDYIDLQVGNFIIIKSTTKPGSRVFEILNETSDLQSLFVKKNHFDGLEDTAFFKD